MSPICPPNNENWYYLEMLAVGIAVGACCLFAALIIYCCNRSSSSLEGSNVVPVDNGKLVKQQ